MAADRIGVVVLTYGDPRSGEELVRELLAADVRSDDIVVLHNPKGEHGRSIRPRLPGIRVVVNRYNVGYAIAMNTGIEMLATNGYAWVLLLTQDARPMDGGYRMLVNAATSSEAEPFGVLGPALVDKATTSVFSLGGGLTRFGRTYHRLERVGTSRIEECAWVDGSVMLIRMVPTLPRRPLDERLFMYGEEPILSLLLRRMGYRTGCVVDSTFSQQAGANNRPGAFAYLSTRNGLELARQLGGRRLVVMRTVALFATLLGRVGRALAAGGIKPEDDTWISVVAALTGLRDFVRGRFGPCPPRLPGLGDVTIDAFPESTLLAGADVEPER